jgi:hypothetical protein
MDEFEVGKIIDLKKEKISEGRGFSGQGWRINLTYENHRIYPDSIMAKFSSGKPQTNRIVKRYAMNEVEIYREIKTYSQNVSSRHQMLLQTKYA